MINRQSILIILIVLALCPLQVYGASGNGHFDYDGGICLYDGKPASLEFDIVGTAVKNGKLFANDICEEGFHQTGVNVDFTGTVTGGLWESEDATITGSWTGGDFYPCSTENDIINDGTYPTSGTITISSTGDGVYVDRVGWEAYLFDANHKVYDPDLDTSLKTAGEVEIVSEPFEILDYTMAEGLKDGYPEGYGYTFSQSDKKAYFWLKLGEIEEGPHYTKAVWKKPDESVYYEVEYTIPDPRTEASSGKWSSYRLWTYISIDGEESAEYPGNWVIYYYIDDELVMKVPFIIEGEKSTGKLGSLTYTPSDPETGDDISFKLSVESPPDEPSYSWVMGEESFGTQPVAWTEIPEFTYSYYEAGTYTVTVTMRDKDNYSEIIGKKSCVVDVR